MIFESPPPYTSTGGAVEQIYVTVGSVSCLRVRGVHQCDRNTSWYCIQLKHGEGTSSDRCHPLGSFRLAFPNGSPPALTILVSENHSKIGMVCRVHDVPPPVSCFSSPRYHYVSIDLDPPLIRLPAEERCLRSTRDGEFIRRSKAQSIGKSVRRGRVLATGEPVLGGRILATGS